VRAAASLAALLHCRGFPPTPVFACSAAQWRATSATSSHSGTRGKCPPDVSAQDLPFTRGRRHGAPPRCSKARVRLHSRSHRSRGAPRPSRSNHVCPLASGHGFGLPGPCATLDLGLQVRQAVLQRSIERLQSVSTSQTRSGVPAISISLEPTTGASLLMPFTDRPVHAVRISQFLLCRAGRGSSAHRRTSAAQLEGLSSQGIEETICSLTL
jgi:hypothetical protein